MTVLSTPPTPTTTPTFSAMRRPRDFRAYLSHRRGFPARVDRQPLDRPRGPDTGRRGGSRRARLRATELRSELGRVDDCCDRDGGVAATPRSPMDAVVDEPSRSRSERTAVWVAAKDPRAGPGGLVIRRLRASRSSVVRTSARFHCPHPASDSPSPPTVSTRPTEVGGAGCWLGGGG